MLVVLGVFGLVLGFTYSGKGSAIISRRDESQTTPREILQIRYTGGEITREQYLQILDDIE